MPWSRKASIVELATHSLAAYSESLLQPARAAFSREQVKLQVSLQSRVPPLTSQSGASGERHDPSPPW